MRKLLLATTLIFGLAGCSDKPAVFTATHQFGGQDVGVTVRMTLNDFSDNDRKEGDGLIEIVKKPGTPWAGSEGAFPITWSASDHNGNPLTPGRPFRVVVPGKMDAFKMDVHPINMTIHGVGATEAYYCPECELLRSGAGLGVLPSVFLRTETR
nr:lipoprotein [uncultured Cupriavidus sp.]